MASVYIHPAYEKASYYDVGVTLGNFWLYVGSGIIYFERI